MIITALVRRPRQQVCVVVDGEPALTVGQDVVADRGLHEGQPISRAELHALADDDGRRRALDAGLRLLSYRPRSEREMRDRLRRRGFAGRHVDHAVARLRQLGYLNDAAFARFWAEQRSSLSPRGRRLIRSELLAKGVAAEVAAAALEGLSDEDAAYQAAVRRLRSLRGLEYPAFRERLGAFLTRRGFSYDVARRTIQRCWEESKDTDDTS